MFRVGVVTTSTELNKRCSGFNESTRGLTRLECLDDHVVGGWLVNCAVDRGSEGYLVNSTAVQSLIPLTITVYYTGAWYSKD